MDFTTSGWSTPRRFPAMESFNDTFSTEVLQKKTERLLSSVGSSKARPEVRRLEEKVARVAAKKCSVEEVSSLYTELDTWLRSEKDDQVRPPKKKFPRLRHLTKIIFWQISSLSLSAALLRAILMNHFAHSEASKAAKTAEANLKNKIDEVEAQKHQAETELRKYVNYLRLRKFFFADFFCYYLTRLSDKWVNCHAPHQLNLRGHIFF
jgi:hypothetical protein